MKVVEGTNTCPKCHSQMRGVELLVGEHWKCAEKLIRWTCGACGYFDFTQFHSENQEPVNKNQIWILEEGPIYL